jgi:hypothetical protein
MTGPRTIQELLDSLAELKRVGAPTQTFEEREAERRQRTEQAYAAGSENAKRAAAHGRGKGAGGWRQATMGMRCRRRKG